MLIKVTKIFWRMLLVLRSIQFRKIRSKLDVKSSNVVIIYPCYPRKWRPYFISDAFANDVALLNAVAANLDSFKIKRGTLGMREVSNCRVFLNMNSLFNVHGFRNYAVVLKDFLCQLERQSNQVFPSSHEAEFWENKVFMHRKFEKLGIKSPETLIFDLDSREMDQPNFPYPFLIKEVHSAGSLGVHKVADKGQFLTLINSTEIRKKNRHVLVQRLLRMDRDLRVIIVGDEIVVYYWRINKSSEWKPTSTKHGSGVDFEFFPEEWREHIVTEYKKLGIRTGAFDVVWEDNDYTNPPYFLEVSPSYQPNPLPPENLKTSYGKYKSSFGFTDGWDSRFIKLIQYTKDKLVREYLKD